MNINKRKLNQMTVRSKYPLSRIEDSSDQFWSAKVKLVGLTNAAVVSVDCTNWIFHPYLDQFMIVILMTFWYTWGVYGSMQSTWTQYRRRWEIHMVCKVRKCKFWLEKVGSLNHVVSAEGFSMDPQKVETVVSWVRPTNVIEIRSFLDLTCYLRRLF